MSRDMIREEGIVWLRDPLKFRYLREGVYLTTRRRQKPPSRGNRLIVGYTTHPKRGTGTTVYHRRFWYLNAWDRDLDPNGPYSIGNFRYGPAPTEAVIPSSIRARAASVQYAGSDRWEEDFDQREEIEAARGRSE